MMRTRLTTILATAAIAAIALTGCQSDDEPEQTIPSMSETPSPSASTAPSEVPSFEEAADEETAIADASSAYTSYWRLVDEIFAAQGEGAEQLEAWATPDARAFAEEQIALAQQFDLTTEGYQTITILDGAYATPASGGGAEQAFGHVVLQACHSEASRVSTTPDGEVIETGSGGSVVNAELIRDPNTGAWNVTADQLAGSTC